MTGTSVPGGRRLSRFPLTLRARLTVVYGGAFLMAGSALVLVMYLLVRSRIAPGNRMIVRSVIDRPVPTSGRAPVPPPGDQAAVKLFEQAMGAYDARTLSSLLQFSTGAVLVLLLVAVGIGWLMAGRTLRPLQEITATARRVADRSLHERIALEGPQDELKELADTFDAMLERLDQAFVGQRRFVADASHELRTPLAVSRTVLEVAISDPDASPDLRELGRTLLVTNERSERLIDGLLALAVSENEPSRRVLVNLADVVAQAMEQVAAEAADRQVTLTSQLDAAPVQGDGDLLERLTLNLLQNGIRHNAPGGWVEVATSRGGGHAELVVTNSGPVVPPYDVEALFEPFRRLHAQRTGSDRGVGLGLAIVRSVTRAHRGVVSAVPREGGGLVMRVRLPAAPASSAAPAISSTSVEHPQT